MFPDDLYNLKPIFHFSTFSVCDAFCKALTFKLCQDVSIQTMIIEKYFNKSAYHFHMKMHTHFQWKVIWKPLKKNIPWNWIQIMIHEYISEILWWTFILCLCSDSDVFWWYFASVLDLIRILLAAVLASITMSNLCTFWSTVSCRHFKSENTYQWAWY